MVTSGQDQSSTIRCTVHGRTIGVFFRPEPFEYVPANYACFHCWVAAGKPERLNKDEFFSLLYEKRLVR